MPSLDVFKSDAFSLTQLTNAINAMPYQPKRLGDMGIFSERGVMTETVYIEHKRGQLSLLPTRPRGDSTTSMTRTKRDVRPFMIPHIPYNAEVLASDVWNVRAFGQETATETVAQVVAEYQAQALADHETTWEWHRLGAVKGIILDADGSSTIYNLFTEFGISQTSTDMDVSADDMQIEGIQLKRRIEDALGNDTYSRIHVLTGDTFFEHLITNSTVKAAYDRWQSGSFLRDDPRYTGFEYPRGVFWENYRGAVGSISAFIGNDEAYAFPMGVPNLFMRFNAPANFVETVNTPGQRLYSKQELMSMGVGIKLHTQSNPLHICTRPSVLQRLHDPGI